MEEIKGSLENSFKEKKQVTPAKSILKVKKLLPPRSIYWVMLLVCILSFPGIMFVDFIMDDYLQLSALLGRSSIGGMDEAHLFTFCDGVPEHMKQSMNEGRSPWFALPSLKINFWRPLSTALHRLDFSLFGLDPVGARIHSLLWYLGIIYVLFLFYKKIIPNKLVMFSLLIFSIAAVHHEPVFWIASRNSLTTAMMCLCSMVAYVSWRQENWMPGLPLSIVLYTVALFCGEASIGMLAYFCAFEIFVAKDVLRKKLFCISPLFTVAFIFIGLYSKLGYGTYGSGFYLNPLSEPIQFISELPFRLSFMLGVLYMGVPAMLLFIFPKSHIFFGGLSFTLFLIFGVLLYKAWKDADSYNRGIMLLFGLGSLGSMVPPAAGMIGQRSLMLPSIGGAVLLAFALNAGWSRWKKRNRTTISSLLTYVIFLGVAFINLVISPLMWPSGTYMFGHMQKSVDRLIESAEFTHKKDQTIIVLQAPNGYVGLYMPAQMVVEGYLVGRVMYCLSISEATHRVHRTAPDTIELEIVDGRMMENPVEILFRHPNFKLREGDKIILEKMRVTILEVDEVGPTRIEFKFNRNLEDPSLSFFAWMDGTITGISLPEVNESLLFPWKPFPSF